MDRAGFAISTEGLARSFGGLQALKNMSLSEPTDIVFGFLGPNGAGKTTTI
jgi:ABC-type multidrug transport system ATPase subunit